MTYDPADPGRVEWEKLMGTDPAELPPPPEIPGFKDGPGQSGPDAATGGTEASFGAGVGDGVGAEVQGAGQGQPKPTIEIGDDLSGDTKELLAQILDELRQQTLIFRQVFQSSQ